MPSQLLKNIQNIQSLIDENKGRLSDGVYVKLSEELKKHYEMIENEVYECIYQAQIIVLWNNVQKTFTDNIKIEPEFKTDSVVLEFTKDQAEEILRNIGRRGYYELIQCKEEVTRVSIELNEGDDFTDLRLERKILITSLSKY
jgi:hypothetical protein